MKNSIPLFIFSLLLILVVCKKSTDSENNGSDLVIKNLGVTFAPWDPATNRAGDFIFMANEHKLFLEFGAIVGTGDGGSKALPTFEYRIDKNASVFAIADGKVTRLVYQQDTQDYEIGTIYRYNSDWYIGYDHVKNPRVKLNAMIFAGDTLGLPGTWSGTLGRFEIMINNNRSKLSYCPFCCFDPTTVDLYEKLVLQHMLEWESFKNDTSLYDEKHHVYPGCCIESMVTY